MPALLEAPDRLLSAEELVERDIMEEAYKAFLMGAWHILEPSTPFIDNWHLDCLCEHLQAATHRELRKIIFNVPPGTAKSLTAAVFWPVWHWLHVPSDRFLTASYKDELSGRDSLKARRLIQSAWFRERWGDRFKLVGDQNAKMYYENDKTGYRLATHVGSGTGLRAQVRILDDPHDIEEAESDVKREGAVEWVRSTWSEREASADTSLDIVIMQRVHHRDVCGYLLELGGFTHVMLPMEFEPKRKFVSTLKKPLIPEDPRTEPFEILDKHRWTRDDIELKKRRLRHKAAGQLQQRPSPEAGAILLKGWWRYWHYPHEPLPPYKLELPDGTYRDIPSVPLPTDWDQEICSWDCAFKDLEDSDFVVGQHWAKKGVNAYLLGQTRGQLDFPATLRAVKDLAKTMILEGSILVEDKANGPAVVSSLKGQVSGVLGVNPQGGKLSRANAYSWVIEAGQVYLPHPTLMPWVEGLTQECADFPNGDYDDQVDALSQALHRLYGKDIMGTPIIPDYQAKFYVSEQDLLPVPGLDAFRFWYWPEEEQGCPYPTCILGQILPKGQIRILDCVQEENGSIESLIDKKVIPVLNANYRGVWRWRDIGNFKPTAPGESEVSLQQVVHAKLKGAVEHGEPDFTIRIEAIKTLLSQTGRIVINRRVSQGERTLLVHEALNGGYSFATDKQGHLTTLKPLKGSNFTAIGECLGHGLARLFVRKPVEPVSVKTRQQAQAAHKRRAKGYGVR